MPTARRWRSTRSKTRTRGNDSWMLHNGVVAFAGYLEGYKRPVLAFDRGTTGDYEVVAYFASEKQRQQFAALFDTAMAGFMAEERN